MNQLSSFLFFVIISIIFTFIYAPFLIKLLYKLQIVVKHSLMQNQSNKEFFKIHNQKSGTPTLGGTMILLSVLLLGAFLVPESKYKWLFLIFWTLFGLYGFTEGIFVYGRKLSTKLRLLDESFGWRLTKLLILYGLSFLAVSFTVNVLEINSLTFFGLQITISLATVILGSLLFALASYAMEITDGADGLVTGQFLISTLSFAVILVYSKFFDLLPLAGLMFGSLLVYLYFNINPARVFMGGAGTFPVAFALLFFSIVTNTVDIFFIIGFVFWVELATSFLQIISIRFFKRKLFKIAPIHHYFESIGWPETKMVQRFWLASSIFAILGLFVFGLIKL